MAASGHWPAGEQRSQPALCATYYSRNRVCISTCSALLGYSWQENVRTNYPTEQLSFQSNYFKRIDFSGRASYSSSDSDNPNYNEFFDGLARNRQRIFTQLGSSNAQRISTSADLGVTYRLTEKLHLVDTFRYENFRIPTGWTYTTNNAFAVDLLTNPNLFTPATCPPPFTAATCPQHVSGSAADIISEAWNQFLNRKARSIRLKLNTSSRPASAHMWDIALNNARSRATSAICNSRPSSLAQLPLRQGVVFVRRLSGFLAPMESAM